MKTLVSLLLISFFGSLYGGGFRGRRGGLGPELVTEGGFDNSGAAWTFTGDFAMGPGDFARCTHSSGTGTMAPATALDISAGKTYLVEFTATQGLSWDGSIVVTLGGQTVDTVTGAGAVSEELTVTNKDNLLFTSTTIADLMNIYNVSVKELKKKQAAFTAVFINEFI